MSGASLRKERTFAWYGLDARQYDGSYELTPTLTGGFTEIAEFTFEGAYFQGLVTGVSACLKSRRSKRVVLVNYL